jgi:hypothetical protein
MLGGQPVLDGNTFMDENTFKEFLDTWRATHLWTETLLSMKTDLWIF